MHQSAKTLLTFIAGFTLLIPAGCKKEKTDNPPNYWRYGNQVYFPLKAMRIDSDRTLYAADSTNKHAIAIYFNQFPTDNGTYKIVSIHPNAPDEAAVEVVADGSMGYFRSDGSRPSVAQVTMTNGKARVLLYNVWCKQGSLHGPEYIVLSASISE